MLFIELNNEGKLKKIIGSAKAGDIRKNGLIPASKSFVGR